MMTLAFEDTTVIPGEPVDAVPELDDVEFPCRVCGKESGPYGGRGPKPKLCADHKKTTSGKKSGPKVTGNVNNLAAQAAGVLTQLNGAITVGLMVVGMRETASAMAACNDNFHQQAFDALVTDPELCKAILRGGAVSGKMMLGLAYAGMGTVVIPTAISEVQVKREERRVRMEEMNPEV